MIASSDMLQMATALFAAITVGLVLYGILNKEFRAQARMRQRILKLASEGTANAAPERSAGARTQRSINAALRDIEQMKRAHYRAPILVRLRRAGLQISPLSYHLIRLGMATLGGLVTHLAGGSGMIVLLVASALGLILPALVLRVSQADNRHKRWSDNGTSRAKAGGSGASRRSSLFCDCGLDSKQDGRQPLRVPR
jgi:Flp pilus assembly protein TadB